MDFSIQVHPAAKNAVMGYVNVILPAVTGIVGVLIGLFVNGRRERRAQRQEVKNIRSLIYEEVDFLKAGVDTLVASTEAPEAQAAIFIHFAQLPIFDAYIGKLTLLSKEEQACLIDLYFWISSYRRDSRLSIITEKATQQGPGSLEEREIGVVQDKMKSVQKRVDAVLECMGRHIGKDKVKVEVEPVEVNEDKLDDV